MKGITMCADCAYYNMKTHKCTRGCTVEPDIENGDDVRFFTDCPLPDVAEVRRGRWIDAHFVSGGDFNRCSECGCYIEKTYFANDYNVRYCPNCGARMDGGADNG